MSSVHIDASYVIGRFMLAVDLTLNPKRNFLRLEVVQELKHHSDEKTYLYTVPILDLVNQSIKENDQESVKQINQKESI